jgi:hypothetical protein
MNMKSTSKLTVAVMFIVLFGSCSKPQFSSIETPHKAPMQDPSIKETDHEGCLQAARELLGPEAEMLKCGHLSDVAHLEAVVGIRVQGLKDDKNGIPISKLEILQRVKSHWESVLIIDGEIKNSEGYVGADFIDDSHPFPYYRVDLTDRGAQWGDRTPQQFTLVLLSMTRDGKVDEGDMGLGIGWNPAVGRFQEIEPNGEELAPEVKTPKHIRSLK